MTDRIDQWLYDVHAIILDQESELLGSLDGSL